jgi:tetratricopeptide (TPR) repeat protein
MTIMNERIEKYFESSLNVSERQAFETSLANDEEQLDDIAFYLKAKCAAQISARDLKLMEKHKEWSSLPVEDKSKWHVPAWISIAAMLMVVLSVLFFFNPLKPRITSRAEEYINQNLKQLPVQLADSQNLLQLAISNYNKAAYELALNNAEEFLKLNPKDPEALKVAALASLQMKEYEQAISYCRKISIQTGLFDNPGKFYEALTYLSRNGPSDELRADRLLQEIIDHNEAGKQDAMKLLGEN